MVKTNLAFQLLKALLYLPSCTRNGYEFLKARIFGAKAYFSLLKSLPNARGRGIIDWMCFKLKRRREKKIDKTGSGKDEKIACFIGIGGDAYGL